MYNINNFIQEEIKIIEETLNSDQNSILKEKYQVLKQAFGKVFKISKIQSNLVNPILPSRQFFYVRSRGCRIIEKII